MTSYVGTSRFAIPEDIRNRPQWVAWRGKRERKKVKKVPINPRTHREASITNPDTWVSFAVADRYAREHNLAGVGFVFSEDDPYCGIDLDDCRDPETGELGLGVAEVLDALDTYAEVSPSGAGVHVICQASKLGRGCSTGKTPWGGKFEIYDRDRFFTVTGDVIRDAPVVDAQETVQALYGQYFPEQVSTVQTTQHAPSVGILGDDEVLELARIHPKTGGMFRKLHAYDDANGYPSRSDADQAYCGMLAFWTGCDAEQMKRLFRGSGRTRGHYADAGHHAENYLDRTVNKAIHNCRVTYDPSYGEHMKQKVREIVTLHNERLWASDLKDKELGVCICMFQIAAGCGIYRNGEVEFNANQENIAAKLKITQEYVSKIIRSLMGKGWLIRKAKGRKGQNSVYRLPKISEPVASSSITYVHRGLDITPPVFIRSRTVESTAVPPVPHTDEPMVKNLPTISSDGIYRHGSECGCWMCEDDAPEYVPERELTGVA